jgi:hypothetical protein
MVSKTTPKRKWSQKYKDSIDCEHPKGFSQKQHCKYGRKKSPRGYNATPKKKNTYFENYDLYSDANPKDTIRTPYATMKDLKSSIRKLEKIYKAGEKPHNRIVQNANVIKQRLKVIYNNTGKGKDRYDLSKRYFDFLKERTKIKKEEERKKFKFKI